MRVLIDECLPRRFKNSFPEHECETVPEAGFAGRKNGLLLSLAEQAGFDVFLTNRLEDLLPHVEGCRSVLPSIRAGDVLRVGE